MYRVSIELKKHEWKFGRTRNAVETQATGECFYFTQLFSLLFTLLFTFYNSIERERSTCFLLLSENIATK